MPKWIQDPETGKLIPAEEYCPKSEEHHFFAQGDFKSFKSPVTGEQITDRGQMRRHMKQHGITPTSEYSKEFMRSKSNQRLAEMRGQSKSADRERKETLNRILGEHNYGR